MSKKISFGFTKLAKKPSVFTNQIEEKKDVELIDCLEGQSIKVIGAVEDTKEPLVIPIKDNAKNLLDRIKDSRKSRELKTASNEDTRPDSELTLDELAARQLLKEAQANAKKSEEAKVHTLPLTADNIPLEGEKEPTLEDYENVPINDFGLAMLRGMGWKDGGGIGKNPKTVAKAEAPELRPKGLGLGATKMVKSNKPPPPVDKEGKELQLVKGAYAKIIAGKYKGFYCEVQGLDEETGRIIVRTKIKQEVLSLNEFLVTPVTKDEFTKNSKVLNNAKYEEYKEKTEIKNEHKEGARKEKRDSVKEEQLSDNEDVKVLEIETKVEYISSSDDRKPSPKNNKHRHRSYSRSPKRYRSRSRSPVTSQKKQKSKSKYRSRTRSRDRYQRSGSSDSEHERRDKKKKSKKSKKERCDEDLEKERYRKKKSKKESRRYGNSGSDSDKNYKHKDKSKSGRSRR